MTHTGAADVRSRESLADLFALNGRVAIVTGAGQGIGRELALTLANVGASVVLVDRDGAAAEEARQHIASAGGDVHAVVCDVVDPSSPEVTLRETVERFGRLDVLVNNAGIGSGNDVPPENLNLATWQLVLNTNLSAYFAFAQAAGRLMIEQGSGGRIIQIASAAADRVPRLTERYPVAYPVSKAGVVMLTRALALQWARHGITVNAISPTFMDTGLIQKDPTRVREMIDSSPFGRLGRPEDLATTVVFLAAPASSFVTGINVLVDGAYTI